MNSSEELDLIDIREHLQYLCPLTQCKGFSNLCSLLQKSKNNQKAFEEVLSVLFDCLCEYGDTPFDLLFEAITPLAVSKIISKQNVWENYTRRVSRIKHAQRAFMEMMDFCQPSFKDAINIAMKVDNKVLHNAFSEEAFHTKNLAYLLAFIFSGVFTDGEVLRALMDNERLRSTFLVYFPAHCAALNRHEYDADNFLKSCSNRVGLQHPLAQLDKFQKLKLMYERPNLARNRKMGDHVVYVPYLFLMNQYRQTFYDVVDPSNVSEQVLAVRLQITECCAGKGTAIPAPDFTEDDFNLETYISYIIHKGTIDQFITFVEAYKDQLTLFHKPHILAILPVMLFKAEEAHLHARITKLICHFVQKVPERAYEYSLYFMSLSIKPFFEISSEITFDAVVALAVNKYVLPPIVRFFLTISQKQSLTVTAMSALATLVQKYPMIIGEIVERIQFVQDGDPMEIFLAKLNLAKHCCISTDDNDSVLSCISKLFKDKGDRFGETLDIVCDLVKNDVLELSTVRKLLAKRIVTEKREKALSAYCRLLSLGNKREDEATDEEFHDLKKSIIEELFALTNGEMHKVASEAWAALGEFEYDDIREAVGEPSSFVKTYSSLHEDRQMGFVEFVRKLIGKEVESYQRPLYTTGFENSEVPPLLSKVDTFKDNLITKNKEETWFWSTTLPLTGPILRLTSSSNKANSALRLLKSCLLHVPESSSQEDMLRLMAGWRIATREALNALAESKNNDILWARDQICKEGKACLTEKKESVDNIMMMLTVLGEVIEEKLKTIDSQQHVDEVSQAQKPWLISVFEFVATRLPKEVKQLREQKANPIYQMLTHSNKSSLFIAIFCTRLLYRNPSIVEFYGDSKRLALAEDRMFVALLCDTVPQLIEDEIPDRKMMWITEEAYGADEMTSSAFETLYQPVIDRKTLQNSDIVLEKAEHIDKFFKTIVSVSRSVGLEAQKTHKKTLEKLWNNGTENTRRKIYEGLAEVVLVSGNARRKKMVPNEKLPEGSILRSTLELFDGKIQIETKALQKMLGSFVNQKRKDGRFLPPLNWLRILERADWKKISGTEKAPLVTLACEQNITEVLFTVVEKLDLRTSLLLAEHIGTLAKLLPRKQFEKVIITFVLFARTEKDEERARILANVLASIQKNMIVRLVLSRLMYKLGKTTDVTDVVLTALNEPDELRGLVSKPFDVWLEARNGPKMHIQRICDLYEAEEDPMLKEAILVLISSECRVLSLAQRYEKVLDVITVSRIARSRNGDMTSFLPIILSIIVSTCEEVDLPLCGFGHETEFTKLMILAKTPFVRAFLENVQSAEKVKPIASFLHPYLVEERNVYANWQVNAAVEMLRHISAIFPEFAATLCNEPKEFWTALLPC